MKQKCHERSNINLQSPSLVLLLKAPFEGTLLEKYSYIGLIEHLIEVQTNNKVKTLIQLPWVPIYADIENLIEVETNNKVKTLIQLLWVPIYADTEHLIEVETNNKVKTLIQLPWVSIYADTENLIQIFGIVIHTQISHPSITKGIGKISSTATILIYITLPYFAHTT